MAMPSVSTSFPQWSRRWCVNSVSGRLIERHPELRPFDLDLEQFVPINTIYIEGWISFFFFLWLPYAL